MKGDMRGLRQKYVTVGLAALIVAAPLIGPVPDATAASKDAPRAATATLATTEVESAAAASQPLGWVVLGGPYGSDPSTLPKGNAVFAVGQAGNPFYRERVGTTWAGTQPLGGQLHSVVAPAEALVGPQSSNFTVFGVGIDSGVYYRTRRRSLVELGGRWVHQQPDVGDLRR